MVTTSEPTRDTGAGFEPTPLSENAVVVMERRIVARDETGEAVETADQCFRRVARNLSQAELRYGGTEADRGAAEEDFYRLLSSLDFLPNSPTLVNAGRDLQQLSACFVLPVPDSIDGIFKAIRDTAVIHKSGGGTGFAFSRLRPANDRVRSTMGVASGPVSFMTVFDSATEAIKQGGTRRGANMGILRVDHPDIDHFISMKADMTTLTNFNISVAVTDEFMQALADDGEYSLISPKSGEVVGRRNARELWQTMVENAWQNGDPGVIFIDRINAGRANPVPGRGPIESTNPCGEQPLYSYDSCNLGSLNLAHFVVGGPGSKAVDFERLGSTVHRCVHLLDNVIEMNRYPIEEIEETSLAIRRIGLGVMGWADLLLELRAPYDSEQALSLAREVMGFIQREADAASHNLAAMRGNFPEWGQSLYGPGGSEGPMPLRNSTRTTIAPTGTLSIIANCSGGVEPVFALAFVRSHYLDKDDPTKRVELNEVNEHFEEVARNEGFYSDALIDFLAHGGHLADRSDVPEWVKEVFVTAHDIAPEAHVRMQAAFQEHTDNAVSKTINFPNKATVGDVATAYQLAYDTGCKGITIYRDGSRALQVLKHAGEGDEESTSEEAGRPGDRRGGGAGGEDGTPRAPPAAGRAPVDHAQVPGGGAGGVHDRRPLRGRRPGRALREREQAGLDGDGADGQPRDADELRAAVRGTGVGAREKDAGQPLRTERAHGQPADSDRDKHHRLHLPLARAEVRRQRAGRATDAHPARTR